MKKKGSIVVISGPSGSGKTTLINGLLNNKRGNRRLVRSVSFTTRKKRSKEIEGRDYFFVSEDEFRKKIRAKKILEWTKYLGYYYGTPKEFVDEQLEKQKCVILCLDLKGARKIKKLYPESTLTIFIMPSSIAVLPQRIINRCRDTKIKEVQKRIKVAQREIKGGKFYDYSVVNKDIEDTIKELKTIITGHK